MNILVAYASAHGSTAETAEKIGAMLRTKRLNVEVVRIQDVEHIDSYDAFVFGSAIHAGAWLPEMTTFLRKSLTEIGNRPVYFWVSCIRIMEHDGPQHVMDYYMIPEILNALNVCDKTAFAGKLKLDEIDWDERWTLAARYDGSTWPNSLVGDFRDWQKIEAWSYKIAADIIERNSEKVTS